MSRKSMIRWCVAAAFTLGVASMNTALHAEDAHTLPSATNTVGAGETGGVAIESHTQPTGQAAKGHVDTAKHDAAGHTVDSHAKTAGGHDDGHVAGHDPAKELTAFTPLPLIFTICVFVLLVIVLRLTAWKPILAGLKSREDAIRNSIEAAAKAKADAERTTRELEARMAEAQRASAQQLQQAKADAQKLADSIKAQAEAESAALKDRTLRDIDAAKQQALAEINAHAADIGVAVARKILQREVKVEDQARLVEESLAQLGTTKV